MRPKILIAATRRWFSTARLAMAFANSDCRVEAVHPPGHFLDHVRSIGKRYRYRGLSPLASFRAAIVAAQPDFVVPCDDVATLHLHRLCEGAGERADAESRRIRDMLQRSVGDPAQYALIESRNEMVALAQSEGIAAPETKCVFSEEQVEGWLNEHGLPAVLKADGTSGGEGVEIVCSRKEALRAFRTLRAPRATHIVVKRALIDRETNVVIPWALRRQRTVSIQSFVRGRDANIALACWQGKVLASISAEVLCTSRSKGPSSLVRLLPDGEMLRAAQKIAGRLNLSGLCGMDFMIDGQTGTHCFIEMNARSTQTCPLALGDGHNPVAWLSAVLAKTTPPQSVAVTKNEVIAFFPSACQCNPDQKLARVAYFDVPWDEPALIRAGMTRPGIFTRESLLQLRSKIRLGRAKGDPVERKQ